MFVARRRRPLAALAAALSVAAGVAVARPPAPPSVPVLVAARDLDTGLVLGPRDVRTARLPPDAVPDHALRRLADARGRPLAAAVRRGEPLTDVRLVGPQLRGLPGTVALPVRFADPDAARLLRPGDRIDVLAARTSDGPSVTLPATGGPAPPQARVVAGAAAVLARPDTGEDRTGGLLILSVSPEAAAAIAGAAAAGPLTYTIRTTQSGAVATESN
ncbi:Flp pilus assembly protein CpaB [Yinghuangia sp. YIM S09857]|uniref:Flp pilus assembly protein CpaB n=1 Tax=Yinghuangia sp. YIM S09857 TaxID=3436929 RepID=UPI003F53B35F